MGAHIGKVNVCVDPCPSKNRHTICKYISKLKVQPTTQATISWLLNFRITTHCVQRLKLLVDKAMPLRSKHT